MQITVRLADPASLLPWPGVTGRYAPAEDFEIDETQPFWAACLRDGSLIRAPEKPARAVKSSPAAPAAESTT